MMHRLFPPAAAHPRRLDGRLLRQFLFLPLSLLLPWLPGVPAAAAAAPIEIIVDTDLGDDIDDAFALALALSSPELRVDAVSTSYGDTALRARMAERLLRMLGRRDVPVAAGPSTQHGTDFRQAAWASGGTVPTRSGPDAVHLLLDRLRAAPPGRITLVALAPLTTIGAAIAANPVAFRRLRRVVMMGGSIHRGYGAVAGTSSDAPGIEYNVSRDPDGLRRLLASGVPVELMPLDATEVALDAPARERLFAAHTPLTDWLATLYPLWARNNPGGGTPVLYDVMPVARLLQPDVCRPVPMRLQVSNDGATRPVAGPPNVSACLDVDRPKVLSLLGKRLSGS